MEGFLEELVFRTDHSAGKGGERHHKWKSQLVPRLKEEGGLRLFRAAPSPPKCGLGRKAQFSAHLCVGAENKVLGPGLRLRLGRVWERGKVAEQAT